MFLIIEMFLILSICYCKTNDKKVASTKILFFQKQRLLKVAFLSKKERKLYPSIPSYKIYLIYITRQSHTLK